jgi:hypothetical protein
VEVVVEAVERHCLREMAVMHHRMVEALEASSRPPLYLSRGRM